MVLTVLFYASLFLIGLQFGAVTLMPMIMTADTVDYYEHETGKRMEGACYSILTLTIKVCLALGTAVGLIFVQKSGYYESLSAVHLQPRLKILSSLLILHFRVYLLFFQLFLCLSMI